MNSTFDLSLDELRDIAIDLKQRSWQTAAFLSKKARFSNVRKDNRNK